MTSSVSASLRLQPPKFHPPFTIHQSRNPHHALPHHRKQPLTRPPPLHHQTRHPTECRKDRPPLPDDESRQPQRLPPRADQPHPRVDVTTQNVPAIQLDRLVRQPPGPPLDPTRQDLHPQPPRQFRRPPVVISQHDLDRQLRPRLPPRPQRLHRPRLRRELGMKHVAKNPKPRRAVTIQQLAQPRQIPPRRPLRHRRQTRPRRGILPEMRVRHDHRPLPRPDHRPPIQLHPLPPDLDLHHRPATHRGSPTIAIPSATR